MVRLLALLTLILTSADHWTTYLCLNRPVDGWQVNEANPLANWLFHSAGLIPGLAIDSAVTLAAVAFLLTTALVSRSMKTCFLSAIALLTGYAVLNNLQAIASMGLWPSGTTLG